jgi:hypothetical protein
MTTPPHLLRRSTRRYSGTTGEVIEKLRTDGFNVDWYKPATDSVEAPAADKCGYFTIYYLEGQTAYTITYDGSKYLDYRTLNKPVEHPCWYCSGCKARFTTTADALAHRDGIK